MILLLDRLASILYSLDMMILRWTDTGIGNKYAIPCKSFHVDYSEWCDGAACLTINGVYIGLVFATSFQVAVSE